MKSNCKHFFLSILILLFFTLLLPVSLSTKVYAADPDYSGTKGWIYYSGEYSKKIKKKTVYLSLNEYTSKDTPIDEGAVYVFSSKKNRDKWKPSFTGEIRRVKKNQYKCVKGKKTYFTFTVKDKKTVVIKQKKTVIKGINIKGKYKLKRRFFS